MKAFFRNIHLYLSLAAGLVIMTCCFTGAILVFEKELQEAFNHNRYYVKKETIQLPLETLITQVKQKYAGAKVGSIKVYSNPERSTEIGVTLSNKGEKKGTKAGEPSERNEGVKGESAQPQATKAIANNERQENQTPAQKGKQQAGPGRASHTAFVNPYTGSVLELYSYRETFFYKVFALHRWLLGGEGSIGKTITGVSTFIFLFILITGIILWWPRNKAILVQRLKIKSNASWKRLNHDLHIVLGFYSAIFLFIFAFTALAWSFKWFNEGIYKVTNSPMKAPEPPHSVYVAGKKPISYDSAFVTVNKVVAGAEYYSLRAPSDSTGIISVTVLMAGARENNSDNYYVDQYSGSIIGSQKYSDRNLGQRVRSNFKPIHVGSIYGLPSKIIAFIVCILGTTFPITGVIMWLNRLKKNKKKRRAVMERTVEESL